jgi:glycerophosphoryl diester phosphodiesterase
VVQQRLPSLLDPPIGFAHRGARAHVRENTLEAFELALRLGATGLESDVWLTSDGVAVLDHDGVVRSCLRRKGQPISTVSRAALPGHVPTLVDLVQRCGTGYHLSLDLKDPRSGSAVLSTLAEHAPDLLDRLWLCEPTWQALLPLRGFHDGVKLVESTRLNRIKEGPERRAATLAEEGIHAINLHHSDWTGGLTTLFHRFDRYTLAWDLQHERLLRETLRMGIDGVFSDWVDRMTDAIRAEIG